MSTDMTRISRVRPDTLAVVLATLVLAGCGSGRAQETHAASDSPQIVRTAEVGRRAVSETVGGAGTFGSRDEISLSFAVGGVVASVPPRIGDRVQTGDRLAALDLEEIEATLSKARSAHDKAQRDLARVQALYADSVATLAQLQDAGTALEVAAADLQAAGFQRRYAEILAPVDGVVLSRGVEAGETVSPGRPILTLGSRTDQGVVRVGLADRDVVRVSRGDSATAVFDAFPGRTFRGTVSELAATAEPTTGTYVVEVRLDGHDGLVDGMVGRVSIVVDRVGHETVIPVEAVLEANGDSARVFVVEDADDQAAGVARRRDIRLRLRGGGTVVVEEGVRPGERIVTEGAAWLGEGVAVRVVR